MAVGLAPAVAAGLLNAVANQTNYTAPAALWVQLHVGDPGAAGTLNPAGNTTRQNITASFPAAATGLVDNDTIITWTNVSTTETYSHYSVHSASTAGTFYWSGAVTGGAVVAGNTFSIPVGALDLTFNTAA